MRAFPLSKLLIDEPPLQVLPTLATRLGLNEAVFLQQLHFLTREKRPGPDGHRWIRKTYSEWRKGTFPFWSTKTIERAAKALAKLGLVLIEQRDKSSRNRDNYYAIDHERYDEWEQSSVRIEPDNLSASEDDNLSGSEQDNLSASYKDQISLDQLNQDHTTLQREDGTGKRKPLRQAPTIESLAIQTIVNDLLTDLESAIGPIRDRKREAGEIKWMLDHGYDPEQMEGCMAYTRSDPWWRDKRVTWATIAKRIGDWVTKGEPKVAEQSTTPRSSNGHKNTAELTLGFDPGDFDGLTEAEIRRRHNMGPDDEILEYKYPS